MKRFLRLLVGCTAALLAAGPATTGHAQEAGEPAPTEPVLVTFTDEATLDQALEGDLTEADAGALPIGGATAAAELTEAEQQELAALPEVVVVEPDAPVNVADRPDDPCLPPSVGCGPYGAWHVDRIDLPSAWSLSHGSGVVIAVVDSGLDMAALNAELDGRVVGQLNATLGAPCQADPDNVHQHGTEVAVTAAAATGNGLGTAGAGWDARVLSVRVFDQGFDELGQPLCTAWLSDLIRGIDLAVGAGVEVINLSLTTYMDTVALRQAVARATAAGVPVVAAAGNAGVDNPALWPGGYPAAYPEVIAVGATAVDDSRAGFSNYGPWVDVYAPGVSIPTFTREGGLVVQQGTSFSAPIVAGTVALMRALAPGASPAALQSALRHGAAGVPGTPGAVRLNAFGATLAMPTADLLVRSTATPGPAEHLFSFGMQDYTHLACDFDGDGLDGVVAYTGGAWYWRGSFDGGPPAGSVSYGAAGYVPVCGDWDGIGGDGIGVYVNGTWYLRQTPTPGAPELAIGYGTSSYLPVTGNWDGDDDDTIGVYVNGTWYLRNDNSPGAPQIAIGYGTSSYLPVTGDWDGIGGDGIGVYVGGTWYLRETPTPGAPQLAFGYGGPGMRPLVGASAVADQDGVAVVVP